MGEGLMFRELAAGTGAAQNQAARGRGSATACNLAGPFAYGAVVGGLALALLCLIYQGDTSAPVAIGLCIIALASFASVAIVVRAWGRPRRSPTHRRVLITASVLVPVTLLAMACQLLVSQGLVQTGLVLLESPLVVLGCWMFTSAARLAAYVGRPAPAGVANGLDDPAHGGDADPEGMLPGLAKQLSAASGFSCVRIFTLSDDRHALVLRAAASADERLAGAPSRSARVVLDGAPLLAEALACGRWQTFAADRLALELQRAVGQEASAGATVVVGPLIASDPSRGLVVADARRADSLRDVDHGLATLRVELARRRAMIAAALVMDVASQIGLPFGRLLRDLPSPLLLLNRYARVIVVNAAAEEALGCEATDLVGRRLCAAAEECRCAVHRALRGDGPVQAMVHTILGDGYGARADSVATIWAVAAPEESGLIAISLAPELQRPAEALADDLSGLDLPVMIAHDLRSPLTALRLASKLAGEDDVSTEDRLRLLANIERLVDRTDQIAMDLLDAYKASTGSATATPEPLNLRRCCAELVDELAVAAADRPAIELCLDPTLVVFTERARLRTVLRNLLSNAIKHTRPGDRIALFARHTADETQITVCDSGPGIAAEEAPFLFDRFYRGGAAHERPDGHGLGLFIARRLVLLMGGRIWIESQSGSGAAFTFTIPDRAPVELAEATCMQRAVAAG